MTFTQKLMVGFTWVAVYFLVSASETLSINWFFNVSTNSLWEIGVVAMAIAMGWAVSDLICAFAIRSLKMQVWERAVWCPGCGHKHTPPLCEAN